MNKEYHKIETLFRRDERTKKLIVGAFRNETIKSLKDNTWQFTEKIDGTNIRIIWNGHKVSFGGRTNNAQIPNHLLTKLHELFSGEANEQLFEQKFGANNVILFGEGYGVKIQNGGLYRSDVYFILFDVSVNDVFLERNNVEDIATYFNIETAPILLEGTIQDGVDYVLNNHKSTIAKNGAVLEGVVGRLKVELNDRLGNRIIVKIKKKDFE